jgi:hypothetical protein
VISWITHIRFPLIPEERLRRFLIPYDNAKKMLIHQTPSHLQSNRSFALWSRKLADPFHDLVVQVHFLSTIHLPNRLHGVLSENLLDLRLRSQDGQGIACGQWLASVEVFFLNVPQRHPGFTRGRLLAGVEVFVGAACFEGLPQARSRHILSDQRREELPILLMP